MNRIIIIGGGTSGFMTSSILAKYRERSGLDFSIKLIHSEKIGSIGVGESTLFMIKELFSYLELKDEDWMAQCNATYKTSVRFEDFYKKGRYFHYPFGPSNKNASIDRWFVSKEFYPETFTPERASLYFNPQSILNEENRLTDDNNYIQDNAAYHFDSHLLGEFLKKYSIDHGVEIINDNFYGTTQDKYGNIESIVCDDSSYCGDLFIDCSGFRSLLLGGVMGEEFIDYGNTLINDKALVAKIPYTNREEQLKNYTNSVALKNGWCWETPLWDCLGYGYVHTNKFATAEEIEQEFFEHVGEEVEYRTVHFKTGRYKKGWVKNVVAVGLSYGFLEPLEATGIATTLENIFRLLECLSKRDMKVTRIDRDLFNHAVGKGIDGYKDFVEKHYYLSSRDDSDYWRYVTDVIDYNHHSEFLDQLIISRELDTLDRPYLNGQLFVVVGMNYSCYSKAMTLTQDIKDDRKNGFEDYIKGLNSEVKQYPSSYKYLADTIYKTV